MKGKYETRVKPRLKEIGDWAVLGCSQETIARKLSVAYSTFRGYIKKYHELSEMLVKYAAERDENVEITLYQKATGFYKTVTKLIKVKVAEYDPTTGRKVRERETVEQVEELAYFPPDTTAIMFYCVNRMGDRYKSNPHKLQLDERMVKIAEERAESEKWDVS